VALDLTRSQSRVE